jgi:cell division septal protein FtsQ
VPRARARADRAPGRTDLFLANVRPSRTSIATGLALFVCAAAAFIGARETSVFAVDSIAVRGGTAAVRHDVRAALAPLRGRSLLDVDGVVVDSQLAHVPWVVSSTFDRAFPHTLVVTVVPERPVVVIRSGARAWLISAHGRVLAPLARGAHPGLPRVWVEDAAPTVGHILAADTDAGRAARAVAPLRTLRFRAHVASVATRAGELTFVLRSGLQLRLGDARDLALKLAVARRILALSGLTVGGYVDVSVPERPVAGMPQVEG